MKKRREEENVENAVLKRSDRLRKTKKGIMKRKKTFQKGVKEQIETRIKNNKQATKESETWK